MNTQSTVPAARRDLGAATCVLIGLTTIVGGGIFALPPLLATVLGPLSFLSFVGAAVVAVFIGLVTAEAAGTTDATGGAYQYSRLAFGAPAGFFVAWLGWVNNIIAWSGISLALVKLLDLASEGLGSGITGSAIATAQIIIFSVINAFGAKPGASVSNVITILKLLPLAFFIIIGMLAFDAARFSGSVEKLTTAGVGGFAISVYRCFFAASGFENIGVIAGDVKDPKRLIPKAVIIAIVASSALYALIQLSIVASGVNLAAIVSKGGPTTPALPLAAEDIGTSLVSPGFGYISYLILLIGAAVSMVGFCAGIAIVAPRYLYAMAGDRFVPPILVKTTKNGAPVYAIFTAAAMSILLVWVSDWLSLLDANVLFAFVQHSFTILATWKLRKIVSTENRFIAPGGSFAILAALGVIVLLCYFAFQPVSENMKGLVEPVSLAQFKALGIVLFIGAAVAASSRLLSRQRNLTL
ncbi:MAG: APC family permease [Planctomycetota bacterium]